MRAKRKTLLLRSRTARKRQADAKAKRSAKAKRTRRLKKIAKVKGTVATKTTKKRKRSTKKARSTKAKRKKTGARASKTETKGCAMATSVFGPCDTRKRSMNLRSLGIRSKTLAANGKPRSRSLHTRILEYDYIRDNVLSFLPAVHTCLNLLHSTAPTYCWVTHEHLFELGKLFPIPVALEIDGRQHAEPVKQFGGEVSFLAQCENDRIKNANSVKENIITKRVPNWDKKNDKAWTCSPKEFTARVNKAILETWEWVLYRVKQNIQAVLDVHGDPSISARLSALAESFVGAGAMAVTPK